MGLRGRVTAALVLTSAVTLAVMALALLAPLQHRLRHDALDELAETTLAARPVLVRLPAHAVRAGSPNLQAAVDDIHHRTGADVAAVDARGRLLAASEPAGGERFQDVVEALARDRTVKGVGPSAEGPQAQVAVPVRRRAPAYGLSLRRPLTGLERAEGVVGRGFLLGAVAAMAAALLMDGFLGRRLVRRLKALRRAVTATDVVAAAEPLRDDGHDEVGDLTRAFAAMQERVREQEEARRTFVATASHELRTPLASLRLMLGLLREDLDAEAPDLDDARHQVDRATVQSERLSRLAADLLDISRLDAAVALRGEPVDLREVARAVVAEFDGTRAPAVVLEQADGPWACGDPGAVAQILRILLDNALRFAPEGTAVTVSLEGADGRCRLGVRDQGPGVAPGDRERIFGRFQRGSESSPPAAGFGLGLAIGRELARRMGGDLRLTSAVGPTCFTLELPAARTTRPAPGGGTDRTGQPVA